jgi:sedoheptulose-bisphosphatase
MPDAELREVVSTLLGVCAEISVDLATNLATVSDDQDSLFGDVQLKVDMIADQRLWDAAASSPLILQAASEEAPEVRDMAPAGT